MNIQDLVIHSAGQRYRANDFRILLEPGVYILLKNKVPIYIGMGKILINSISRSNSHSTRKDALKSCDRILLYPCKSLVAAKDLEKLLIQRLQPASNIHHKYGKLRNALGITVHKSYVQIPQQQ